MGRDITMSEELTDDEWLAEIGSFGEERGYYRALGKTHAAVFVDRSLETLLVHFDTVPAARATNPAGLPHAMLLAEERGWSHLSLFSRKATWFRDPEIYGYFDRLTDTGFFEDFDRIIFYGAGSGGYAAAAYSVAAPGSTVITIAPQATLETAVTEWDDRFFAMRRTCFTDRYGYAPDMVQAADRVYIVYDPNVELDAMHAVLFRGKNIDHIRFRHAGPGVAREVVAMNALRPIFDRAAAGTLNRHAFYLSLRSRRRHLPYLRSLLNRVHAEERSWLTVLLCRAVLRHKTIPRFEHHLELAEQKLRKEGRALPAPRGAADRA